MPLFVNATAGSTVYGAFDPINEIADICEKYNLWLHVDVSIYRRCGSSSSNSTISARLKVRYHPGSVGRRTFDVQEASPQAERGGEVRTWEQMSFTYNNTSFIKAWMKLFRANSVTWNPHKMMGVPLQCSAILVREKVRWEQTRGVVKTQR